jgi:O-acetylhomoserine/O-acetylserine sulfhydrylase-like pyridoxal-dependent enzyme
MSGGSIFPPINVAVAFPFADCDTARRMACGELAGYAYTRVQNPTNNILEERLAALEGGEACLVTSSGLASLFLGVLGLVSEESGCNFVSSKRLYGGSYCQFRDIFPLLNIEVRWVERPEKQESWEALIDEKTKLLYFETPSNPDLFITDIEGLVSLAKKRNLKTMIDATLATPAILRPLEMGVDVVTHSTTKYLSGHSAALGGALIGQQDFIDTLRKGPFRLIGTTMNAFSAWLTLIGIETLHVRMPRMIDSAQQIAEYLDSHPKVEKVNFPGLKSHPQYSLAMEQMGSAGTSLLSFSVKGGMESAWRVIENVKIPCRAGHLGGNQSIIVHPATTTHGKVDPEVRLESGIFDNLIRYSVGLEDAGDLISDLEQALEKI